MLQYLTDAKKYELLMKLLLRLNGSYATITTADGGSKLENVPVIVQPGQAVELLVWL
jgi:molybdopterin-containing oxidoreductase family iron-sulfur binding subunit